MYELDAEVINKIKAVFEKFPEITKAVLYGSRAKGDYRKGSDIDLTLYGSNLSVRTIYNVTEDLDNLYLPYSFDISIYKQINNPDLIDHIKRVGQVFYERIGSRQNTDGDGLPEGWEWKKLGEVCDYDKNHGSYTKPYVGLEDIESNTAKFIGSPDIRKVKNTNSQ